MQHVGGRVPQEIHKVDGHIADAIHYETEKGMHIFGKQHKRQAAKTNMRG